MSHGSTKSHVIWASLVGAVYVGFSVATWQRALIPDELRPLIVAKGSLGDLLEFARLDLVQTPLSYVVQWVWLHAFGHSDAAAKGLALLVGVSTLALFTLVAARLSPQWRWASAILLLMFLRVGSPPNLIRMYGLLLLLVVAAIYCWERWRQQPTIARLAAWALIMACVYWTHGSGLLLLAGFALATWFYGPPEWSPRLAFAAAGVVSVLTLVPWIVFVSSVFENRGIGANVQAIRGNPTAVLARIPFHFLTGMDSGSGSPSPPPEETAIARPLTWVAIALHLALLGAAWPAVRAQFRADRRRSPLASTGAMALLCAGPILLLYTFSITVVHALHPRYMTALFPAYCLVVVGLAGAGGRIGRGVLLGFLVPWLVIVSGVTVVQHVARPTLRDGIEVVARERTTGDLVLCDRWQPLGYQVVWDWTNRLGRSDPVTIVDAAGVPWLRSIFPGTSLESLPIATTNRVWLFRPGARTSDRVGPFLIAHGFHIDRVIVDGWYHLALYAR
jgi:hypothetical protein